jgi:hypothetical protein
MVIDFVLKLSGGNFSVPNSSEKDFSGTLCRDRPTLNICDVVVHYSTIMLDIPVRRQYISWRDVTGFDATLVIMLRDTVSVNES